MKTTRPCISCGKLGHTVYDCKQKKDICYRCGEKGHSKLTCCAEKDVNGNALREHLIGQVGATLVGWFKGVF